MAKKFKKILSMLIIFVMTIVNYGMPLQVLAAEKKSFFEFDFFSKKDLELVAYFDDDSDNDEKISNVNDTVNLTVEMTPREDEYLQSGILRLNLTNGNENNFAIKSLEFYEEKPVEEEIEVEVVEEKEDEKAEETSKSGIFSFFESVGKSKKDVSTDVKSAKAENVIENTINVENETFEMENTVDADVVVEEEEIVEVKQYEAKKISDNEIELKNIINPTTLYIELEYKQSDKINVSDLYGEIEVALKGDYIDEDLESIEINKAEVLTLGWEYEGNLVVNSEYVKVSPFTVGENYGTILENEITISRDIKDEKYLPVKETYVKVQIPEINGILPIAISVRATKLDSTLNSSEEIAFTEENWIYDSETGILEIKVSNDELVVGSGEDKFDIICRYEEYIHEEVIDLEKNVAVTVEEYSANENNILEESIEKVQTLEIKAGELMSCSPVEAVELINKGKIYANSYREPAYETQFVSSVNLTVLTSDLVDDITLSTKDQKYVTLDGTELSAANDVKYKGIRFNKNEIKEILENGSTIDIIDEENNVLHTITKDSVDASIEFETPFNNLSVRINNIVTDGTMKIDFVKVINRSEYSINDFININEVKSSMDVLVKYEGFEETFSILDLETTNKFENTKSDVTFTMNKTTLSSIKENQNVEFKIELLNSDENSDFFKNPSFEIVFPEHVKEITLNSINTLYKNGLSISDYQVVEEHGVKKIRVNLTGTQTDYNFSDITNGTNIILDTNIILEEMTPQKHDNIKLYFNNEAATSYSSEVAWSIAKSQAGSVLPTNGYNAITFSYQTPMGFVTINGMQNYDNSGNIIKTMKQGDITARIEMESASRVVTMNLGAVNNTGNNCTDVRFLGRIPTKGTTDVITGKNLESNIDTKLVSRVTPSIDNDVLCDIYYSANPAADSVLDYTANGWIKDPADISEMKSFLIVPQGVIGPETSFNFTYDFEVPENLPYDVEVYGNFGAFYNNHTEFVITSESTAADLVGLATDAGAKLEATMAADIVEDTVLAGRRIKYSIKVENVGSMAVENVTVNFPIPENSIYVEKEDNLTIGDYGFGDWMDKKSTSRKIGTLNPGEAKVATIYVRAAQKQTLAAYAHGMDEEGYFRLETITETKEVESENLDNTIENTVATETITRENKVYITEVPDMFVEAQATVTSTTLANPVETNKITKEVIATNFDITTIILYDRVLDPEQETEFSLKLKNVSGKKAKDVVAVFNMGKVYSYMEGNVKNLNEDIDSDITVDMENGKVYFPIGDMEHNENVIVESKFMANLIRERLVETDCYFTVTSDNFDDETGTKIPQQVAIPWVETENITAGIPETINEGEEVTLSLRIKNAGVKTVDEAVYECNIPDCLDVIELSTGDGTLLTSALQNGKVTNILPILYPDEYVDINMVVRAKNLAGVDPTKVVLNMIAKNDEQPDVGTEPVEFTIINTEKTEDEIRKEEQAAFEKAEQEYLEQNPEDVEKLPDGDGLKTEEPGEQSQGGNNAQNGSNGSGANGNNAQNGSNSSNQNNSSNGQNSANGSSSQNGNSSSNGSNTQSGNNGSNAGTNNTQTEKKPTYAIKGKVWFDKNKNGYREDNEAGIASVKVQLLDKDNKTLKTVTTTSNGIYSFTGLENGKYKVAYVYNANEYMTTTYMKSGIAAERNSDAIESKTKDVNAITNEMTISDSNIENVDLGLQTKDIFDIEAKKYISKITVTTDKGTKTYEYDDEEIAKVDIHSKQINGAKVELEYVVVLENKGSIEGKVEQVIDYLTNDVSFDEAKNKDWQKGNDGKIYIKNINQQTLKAGDKKEYKLYVTKEMTAENTGVLSNKIEILKTSNDSDAIENDENNVAVQNTIITVSTGYAATIAIFVAIITVIVLIVLISMKKLPIDFNFKKVYKTKEKTKKSSGKIFK